MRILAWMTAFTSGAAADAIVGHGICAPSEMAAGACEETILAGAP
jgi:hypothetical protein